MSSAKSLSRYKLSKIITTKKTGDEDSTKFGVAIDIKGLIDVLNCSVYVCWVEIDPILAKPMG